LFVSYANPIFKSEIDRLNHVCVCVCVCVCVHPLLPIIFIYLKRKKLGFFLNKHKLTDREFTGCTWQGGCPCIRKIGQLFHCLPQMVRIPVSWSFKILKTILNTVLGLHALFLDRVCRLTSLQACHSRKTPYWKHVIWIPGAIFSPSQL